MQQQCPSTVKVLRCIRAHSGGNWSSGPDQTLSKYCETALQDCSVQVAFLQPLNDGTAFSLFDRQEMQRLLGVPKSFWSPAGRETSGRFDVRRWTDASGKDVFTLTCRFLTNEAVHSPENVAQPLTKDGAKFLRRWTSIGIVTRWSSEGSFLTMLPMASPKIQENMIRLLNEREGPIHHNDPFSVLAILLESVMHAFDYAVWSWRDHIRYTEQRRNVDSPQSKYTFMHELARNAINCAETLATGLKVLESITEEHAVWAADHGAAARAESQDVSRSLRGHKALMHGLHLRSCALEARLRNEISLSIFSTTFFTQTATDNGGTHWQMSDRFWVYWAFALPLTALTLVAWVAWYKYFLLPRGRVDYGADDATGHRPDRHLWTGMVDRVLRRKKGEEARGGA
ncbi:hypothetical protein ANO11243_010810 [Dothideomycetidae sp. 11243]|nr:hypothetical protein ANO11243_010810 [fungal sp. No.11243]